MEEPELKGDVNILLMKHIRWRIINFFIKVLKPTNTIIFESNPDLACNTFALYEFMLQKGVNRKYKMIWLVRDPDKYADYGTENVFFTPKYPKSFIGKIKRYIICYRAIISVCCNLPLPNYKVNDKQLNIYLDHGSPLKDMTHGGKKFHISCGYYISQAPFFHKYILETYDISKECINCLGVPRNDQLYYEYNSLGKLEPRIDSFAKTIIWVPTFRSAEGGKRKDSSFEFPIGLPIIYSNDQMIAFNDYLREKKICMIIKPHPAQDLFVYDELELTNILFLTNEKMLSAGIQTNELLAQTDAMITDYSGIYYDYLLLNKPIGITLDDYKEYGEVTGYMFDNLFDVIKGEYIYNYSELISFIDKVSEDQDDHLEERMRIKNLTNKYDDANSSKRVYEFIAEKMNWDEFE